MPAAEACTLAVSHLRAHLRSLDYTALLRRTALREKFSPYLSPRCAYCSYWGRLDECA